MDPKKTKTTGSEEMSREEMSALSDSLAENKFSIDEALNTKGFAEFVALHDDAESILEDEKRAEEVLAVFEKKDELIEFSRKMLSEQIGKEIGAGRGLDLSREDLAGVDEFLSKMAVEDSKGFLKLAEKAERFENDTAEIGELEARLKELGANIDQGIETDAIGSTSESLAEKMGVLQKIKGTDGLSVPMNSLKRLIGVRSIFVDSSLGKTRDTAEEKYGLEKNWYGKFKNIDDQIEITQGLLDLQRLKKSLVRDVFPSSVIEPIIQEKVSKHLSEMALSTKLEELEKAHEFLEKARLASEKGDTSIDYLGTVNEGEMQDKIDESLAGAVALKVGEAINRSTLGDKALARLETSIKSFIERENLGSKDKDGYKDFLVRTLEDQISALPPKPDSKAKAVLIKRIIIKINNA